MVGDFDTSFFLEKQLLPFVVAMAAGGILTVICFQLN